MTRAAHGPVDWDRVERLFDELIALPAADRAARIEMLRSGEPALARELASLLACAPRADDFFRQLPRTAAAAAADLVRSGSDSPASDGSSSVPNDDHPGSIIAQYRVEELIGRGGMGVVYRATDTRLNRPVALKFLPPHHWVDPRARERLRLEARAAAALDHPNICTVYEVGETPEGALFLAMAYYEGETLRERLRRGPLELDAAVHIAVHAARALGAAHARGIVHRDVKPGNLMLTPDGTIKLLDFGLARLADVTVTVSGQTPGTIAYMAPEQVRGERADVRSDLWALGVVLFEMLTGKRPFLGDSEAAVLHAILTRHVDVRRAPTGHPAVPAVIVRVVERLLRKEPAERYQSADELLADLSSLGKTSEVSLRGAFRWFRRPRTRRVRVAAIALPALVTSAIGVLYWREDPGHGQSRAVATEARVASLAVLPFKNYSGDPAQEYFADGMTDELTSTLTKIEGLRVVAHQSVRQFKHSDRSIPQIAQLLGVKHVVDGSVLQDGDSVRITATLIDGARNAPIWTDRFVRARREVLALQQEVAVAIGRAVEVALTPQDRLRLADKPIVDPAAFDLYVRGTQLRYNAFSPNANSQALRYFEAAIAKDSAYAPAYAGVATLYTHTGDEARARQFAAKALVLDSNLAEAWVALGNLQEVYDRDWVGAERSFREAIRLNPGYAEAHHELSMNLMRRKRFDEALREARLPLYLAPMTARFEHGLGEIYLFSDRSAEALGAANKALALDSAPPSHFLQAAAYAGLGRFGEAAKVLERCIPLGCGDNGRALLGYVHGVAGRREEALRIVDTLSGRWKAGKGGAGIPYLTAQVLAGLGDRERALDWLERGATRDAHILYAYAAIDPAFRSLHAEPRFRALLKKLRLDEWQ